MSDFQLVMRSGPTAGKIFPLSGNEVTIGRDAPNNIMINDAEVSRRHARLTWQGTGYILEDAGSTNGTFVNGQRISRPHALRPGEVISLGENIVLMYEATSDAYATMVSASARATAKAKPPPPPEPAPAPAPAYAGQVPAGPAPAPAAPAKKRISPLLIIGLILLLLVCACVAFFIIIDQLGLWCQLFNLFGISWQGC